VAEGVNERNRRNRDVVFVEREGEKGGSLRDFQPIEVHPGTSCQKIVSFVHSSRLPVGILLWGLAESPAHSNEDANPNVLRAVLVVARAEFPTNWTVPCTIGKHTVWFVIAGALRVRNLLWGARPRSGVPPWSGARFLLVLLCEDSNPTLTLLGYQIDPMTSLTSITRLLTVN
jgi:hypothetical protein